MELVAILTEKKMTHFHISHTYSSLLFKAAKIITTPIVMTSYYTTMIYLHGQLCKGLKVPLMNRLFHCCHSLRNDLHPMLPRTKPFQHNYIAIHLHGYLHHSNISVYYTYTYHYYSVILSKITPNLYFHTSSFGNKFHNDVVPKDYEHITPKIHYDKVTEYNRRSLFCAS